MTIAHMLHVPWGAVRLVIDNADFAAGYEQGRFISFHEVWERNAEGVPLLRVTDALGTMVQCDDEGHFVLDEDICPEDGLERQLGILVGFLSGPLCPWTAEETAGWEAEDVRNGITTLKTAMLPEREEQEP